MFTISVRILSLRNYLHIVAQTTILGVVFLLIHNRTRGHRSHEWRSRHEVKVRFLILMISDLPFACHKANSLILPLPWINLVQCRFIPVEAGWRVSHTLRFSSERLVKMELFSVLFCRRIYCKFEAYLNLLFQRAHLKSKREEFALRSTHP